MKLFFSKFKKLVIVCFILLTAMPILSGCGAKKQKLVTLQTPQLPSNPVKVGQFYLENLYYEENKMIVYELFSKEVQKNINFNDFSTAIDELISMVDLEQSFICVVPLDTYIFNNEEIAVYYLTTYEYEGAGVFYAVQLILKQELGLWKIHASEEGKNIDLLPVIARGDLMQLTRKELSNIFQIIEKKKQDFVKRDEITEQKVDYTEKQETESEEEKIKRVIKKEMIVGKTYFDVGNYEKAKAFFEKVLTLNPDDKEAQDYLKKTLTALKQKETELKRAEERIKKAEEELKAAQERALKAEQEAAKKAAMQQKAAAETKVETKTKEEEKTQTPQEQETVEYVLFKACYDLGKKLYDNGDYRKSILQFQKALSLQPDNKEIQNYIEKCEKAIQINPAE